MRDFDYSSTIEFLESFFRGTEHAVDLRALGNDRDDVKPVTWFTRDPQIVSDLCQCYDGPGRGIFFGVATRLNGSYRGRREDLAELPGLWVDIDCYKLGITKEEALTALRGCPLPPTVVIDSGGGLHAYWLFREPLDVRYRPEVGRPDTVKEDIDSTLKQLAGVFAGDTNTCDITRILRLVGSHNSKTDELRPVTILEASGNRYDLSDLQEMLDTQRPLIERPAEAMAEAEPLDPYAEFAKRYGFKAPIDVEARLAAMSYMADGDAGIHQTQLSCSASLVAQGHASDEGIAMALLSATQAAAGHYGLSWNWRREEKAIANMIATARAKFGSKSPKPPRSAPAAPPQDPPPPGGEGAKVNGTTGQVVDLDAQRVARKRTPAAPPDGDTPLIARLGEAVIDYWQETYGLLTSTKFGMSTYSAAEGVWTHLDDKLKSLKVAIQGIFAAARAKPQSATVNAVLHYVTDRPKLYREDVQWDASGYIVCRNCCVNPEDGSTRELGPDLYATWRIDCDYDPAAACPKFFEFVESTLEGVPVEEVPRIVATLGEHMGASLVKGKVRSLRKALFLLGKSRSGKTRFANIYRALLGGAKRCTAIKLADLDDRFGMAPLATASAWIADDVVKQGGSGRYAEPINAERLKNIITGEPVSIRLKGGSYVEDALDIPVIWTGNNLPQIRDDSDAVYNRLLIFPLNREWPEKAPNPDPTGREIDQVLIEEELAGILNFAIFGYARLRARGYYDPPPSMRQAVAELKANNQPLVRWIEECTAAAADTQVDNRDLMASLRGWWLQEYGDDDRVPAGRTVNAALKRHYPTMQTNRSHGCRISAGIELTEDGVACLRHAQDTTAAYGKTVGSGCEAPLANHPRSKF